MTIARCNGLAELPESRFPKQKSDVPWLRHLYIQRSEIKCPILTVDLDVEAYEVVWTVADLGVLHATT